MIDDAPLHELVADWAGQHHCPSLAWGVVRHGEIVAAGSTGAIDGGRPPTEHTVYRIASMTKSFSAAVTLALRDDGLLALDAPIDRYVPEFARARSPTSDAPPVTIRDLLSMTSGLVTDDAWADRHLDLTDDEFDRLITDGLVYAQPTGTDFEYSNFGFALLGRIVERATGSRIQTHITERLLDPLGMAATTWVQPDHDEWARPRRWIDDRWQPEVTAGDGLIAPMGGIWTTVADLACWVAWLADAFPARDGTDDHRLRRGSRREMQTPQRFVGMRTVRGERVPVSYGYGIRILHEPGHGAVFGHSGGFPGYGSNMRWTAGGSIGVIALANVTYAPAAELTALIHDRVAEQTGERPSRPVAPVLEHAARRLVDVLDRWSRGEPVADDELDTLFADNVDPDEAFERRAAAAAHYESFTLERIEAINDARAHIECSTGSGERAKVTFALAPVQPARVQRYDLEVDARSRR